MTKNRDMACSLIESGYKIIPIAKGEKYPVGIANWQKASYTTAHLDEDKNLFATAGIGIICGEVIGIDIDVHDSATVELLRQWCLTNIGSAPERIGREPKTLLVYRKEVPIAKMVSVKYEDCIERKHVVEILSKGQQFVAFAIHPDTGKPYTWPRGSLLDIPFVELSTIEDKHLTGLFDYFNEIRPKDWEVIATSTALRAIADQELNHKAPLEELKLEDIKTVLKVLQAEADNYDSWLNMGMALHHQFSGSREGFDLWDEWSEKSDNYDEKVLKSKWSSFNSLSGGMTFRSMIFKANETSGKKVISTGSKRTIKGTLEGWVSRYWLVKEGSTIFDSLNPKSKRLNITEFKLAKANERMTLISGKGDSKDVSIFGEWAKHPDRLEAENETYIPGESYITRDSEDKIVVNTYFAPEFEETISTDKLAIFHRHMEYLLPIEYERKWFVQWMAYNLQFPQLRCKVTPLHVSDKQGTGRGWISELLFILLGRSNCAKALFAELCGSDNNSKFNQYLYHTTLCVIDEAQQDEKIDNKVTERLKTLLTDDFASVDIKYGFKGTAKVFTNFLLFTNSWKALPLSLDDRRINVLTGPKAPRATQYYDTLYNWLHDKVGIAQLYNYLMRMNLSTFNNKTSFLTEGKTRMLKNTTSVVEEVFIEMLTNPPIHFMSLRQINKYIIGILTEQELPLNYTKLMQELRMLRFKSNFDVISRGKGHHKKEYYVIVPKIRTKEEIEEAILESDKWNPSGM